MLCRSSFYGRKFTRKYQVYLSKIANLVRSFLILTVASLLIINCGKLEPEREILITTDSVTTVSRSSCKVWGTFWDIGGEQIEEHGFCWAETQNPTYDQTKLQLGLRNSKGSFSGVLEGLTANTTYYVRAYAKDGDRLEYGEQLSFSTALADPPTVITYDAHTIASSSACSGGNVTSDGGSAINMRGVCWNISGNPTVQDPSTDDGSDTGIFESTITGLGPSTTYYIRAYATNSSGTGYGSQKDFTTTATDPVPAADFSVDDRGARVGRDIQFTDLSTNEPTSWIWNFGDGKTSTEQNAVHSYSSSGNYTITLTVQNSYGANTEVKANYVTILPTGNVTDCDGNTYYTIQLGDQWWMEENLAVTHFTDGSSIPLVEGTTEWNNLADNDIAYCSHDNTPQFYGYLYTWTAAMNGAGSSDSNPSGIQGVCPSGWHLPSDSEWRELEMYLGMSESLSLESGFRGTDEACMLSGDKWLWANGASCPLTDSESFGLSGFHATPAGFRFEDGVFMEFGWFVLYWTSTDFDSERALQRHIDQITEWLGRWDDPKDAGVYVRCVKD